MDLFECEYEITNDKMFFQKLRKEDILNKLFEIETPTLEKFQIDKTCFFNQFNETFNQVLPKSSTENGLYVVTVKFYLKILIEIY